MNMRAFAVATLIAAFGFGCKKSGPAVAPPPVEKVARIHWLGKKRLAAETNASYFMSLWNLAESVKLEAQTLHKLSLAPWQLRDGNTATNAASAQLRPLLEDILQQESCLEIRQATNQSGELAFAIRLEAERADLWETNLAAVAESLTGLRTVPAQGQRRGWSLKKHDPPNLIELTRAGDWTLVGLAEGHNGLLADFLARIQQESAPFATPATNLWFEADLDPCGIARAFPRYWKLPEELPKTAVAMIGDGEHVRTRGQLRFARPLSLAPARWNIPTNLIHEPLASFTAVRGTKSWLTSHKFWSDLQIGTPPNEIYCWSLQGNPLQTYFAAPLPNASRRVHELAGDLMKRYNSRLSAKGWGIIEEEPGFNGARWKGIPFMAAYLQAARLPEGDFVNCGLLPILQTNRPPPAELLQQVSRSPDLVGYDWEITGPRVEAWVYVGQLFRVISHKAQLPPESLGMAWLKAMMPKLGNCATEVTRTGPDQLSFARKSTLGFSALELHLFADWLESPRFPVGLHTFLAPPDIPSAETSPAPSQP
jgi:hypothetical protein